MLDLCTYFVSLACGGSKTISEMKGVTRGISLGCLAKCCVCLACEAWSRARQGCAPGADRRRMLLGVGFPAVKQMAGRGGVTGTLPGVDCSDWL